jgi:hypothetical protein
LACRGITKRGSIPEGHPAKGAVEDIAKTGDADVAFRQIDPFDPFAGKPAPTESVLRLAWALKKA